MSDNQMLLEQMNCDSFSVIMILVIITALTAVYIKNIKTKSFMSDEDIYSDYFLEEDHKTANHGKS